MFILKSILKILKNIFFQYTHSLFGVEQPVPQIDVFKKKMAVKILQLGGCGNTFAIHYNLLKNNFLQVQHIRNQIPNLHIASYVVRQKTKWMKK